MIKIILFNVLFFCLIFQQIQAQNKKILDSLNIAYQNTKYDTTKILILTAIAFEYRDTKPDTCIFMAEKALMESVKIGFERGKVGSLRSKGSGYIAKGEYVKALNMLQTALVIAEKMSDSKMLKINILHSIGLVYSYQSNYPLAFEYYQKSLKQREEIGDKRGIITSLNNIANIYRQQGNYVLALEHLQKSLNISEEIVDKQLIAYCLSNIGFIYYNQGNYSLALDYYQKSLKISEETNDKRSSSYKLNNIGDIYRKKENYAEAIIYYEKSLLLKRKIGDRWATTYTLNGLAQVCQQQKNYDKAIEYAQEGLKIAQEIKALAEIKMLSETLYQTYKSKGEYSKALDYFELAKQTNDSLFTVEKTKSIANLESRFLLEKKERELILLAKDNELSKLDAEKKAKELLFIRKEAEAEHLVRLATQEKDKRKQDSLFNLAEKARLEAENLKIKEFSLEAENKAKELEIEKRKEAENLQQKMNYLISFILLIIALFLRYFYKNWLKEKKAKEVIAMQKEEIQVINKNLADLVKKRTIALEERNKQLSEYAFYNAHELRRPVATILGLYQILKMEKDAATKELIFKYLDEAVFELDAVVNQIQKIVAEKN